MKTIEPASKTRADKRRLQSISDKTRKSYNLAAEKYFQDFKDEMKQKEFDRVFLDEFSSHFTSESMLCDLGCGQGTLRGTFLTKG